MYMHMVRTWVWATVVNTFRKQQQKVWRPPTLAQTHQGHNPHRTAHKQSKDKHNKSPPPRRRVDPDRPYATGARAGPPTDSARQHGQKNQAHPLARLDEDAIIDPNFMVVLEVEAENDDKDGRVEACGACEAVLACVGGVCGWVWRWADGAGDMRAHPHEREVDGRRRGEDVRVEFPV